MLCCPTTSHGTFVAPSTFRKRGICEGEHWSRSLRFNFLACKHLAFSDRDRSLRVTLAFAAALFSVCAPQAQGDQLAPVASSNAALPGRNRVLGQVQWRRPNCLNAWLREAITNCNIQTIHFFRAISGGEAKTMIESQCMLQEYPETIQKIHFAVINAAAISCIFATKSSFSQQGVFAFFREKRQSKLSQ